jgi:hypothetical protein
MNSINTIKSLISNGSTFARIETLTTVKTAAKHKAVNIQKHTIANVQLFGTINDYDVYRRMVIKSSNRIDGQSVDDFQVSENYFYHDNACYSIVYNKKTDLPYLYAVYNNVSSTVYTIDGIESDKITVAEYLTPSEKEKMLGDNSIVYNKTNDVLHSVIVRTIKLENIISIKCNKMELALNGGYTTALHA